MEERGNEMMQGKLVHGGDLVGYEEEYGIIPLDLSANVSPLGVPESVQKAICAAVAVADRYPDPLCRKLRKAIETSRGIPAEMCLCGNGAADIIFRLTLARKPKKALVTAPTFAEYRAALETVDCRVVSVMLQEEDLFALPEDFPERIENDIDMVFLCEPNNPSGISSRRSLLERILTRCEEIGALLVVDECFRDFLEDPLRDTMEPFVREHPNLLILKAFTKLYGMAGVRLGYCFCSDVDLLEAMRSCGQPWSVSSLAQCAGMAAAADTDYVKQVRALVARERPFLFEGLKRLGLKVIPGEANYLLFRASEGLYESLHREGIMVRSCANYEGLDETWYRTAVKNRADSQRLLAAIEHCEFPKNPIR